jgi:DNA repair photolyase
MNEIVQIQAKSVVTAQNPAGSIPYDFTINPYRGCLFGCSYCYASRFVYEDDRKQADWGHWVEVKANAVDLLQRESGKLFGKTIFLSSATDPYQPIERQLGLTRALLEVLLFAFPRRLHIQTRSPLVVRDIDLFLKFGSSLDVGISLPTDSDVVRRAFEPRAPAIFRRLRAARELREVGIRVTASVAPLLPCTPDRLARMVARCFDSAWVDGLNFYGKEDALRAVYRDRGWESYLESAHLARVKEALVRALAQRDANAASAKLRDRLTP